jgi:hypothetical protein
MTIATVIPADPTLELRLVARLLGDPEAAGDSGPQLARLIAAARYGQMQTLDDPNFLEVEQEGGGRYRIERADLRFLHVARTDLAAWLAAHGAQDDRASPAAEWAATTTEGVL